MQTGTDDIIIGIESSGGKASVAISNGHDILAMREKVARHGHATWMITLARDALADCGLAPDACSAIVAGRGPGSFTGIRVALAAAKGLGLALGIPAYGVSSLHAMAHAAADGSHPVVALVDSRRGSFFLDLRDPGGKAIGDIRDIDADAIIPFLAGAGSDWLITGHTDMLAEIQDGLNGIAHAVVRNDPDAAQLCSFFSSLDADQKENLPLDPLYLSAPLLGPDRS